MKTALSKDSQVSFRFSLWRVISQWNTSLISALITRHKLRRKVHFSRMLTRMEILRASQVKIKVIATQWSILNKVSLIKNHHNSKPLMKTPTRLMILTPWKPILGLHPKLTSLILFRLCNLKLWTTKISRRGNR